MQKTSPIGFFDSGYGGLTILKEVQTLLPQYDYLYLGDNSRAPYGTKSLDVVYQYTWECVQFLFDKGCELVILACNTASSKALRRIQQNDLVNHPGKRVLGVIRPSAEVVGDFSSSNQIIVLGTNGTISSNTYIDEFAFLSPQTTVHQYACPLWVSLIENGNHNSPEGEKVIKSDLQNVLKSFPEADVILLGCTHYPVLQEYIEENIPKSIQVISQGKILAESLKSYLDRHHWMREKLSEKGNTLYLTTGNSKDFEEQAQKILGISLEVTQVKI